MIRRQVDPAQLEGEALDKWYRRSPGEIEEERSLQEQAEYEAFFGLAGARGAEAPASSWQEARVAQPRMSGVRPPNPRPAPVRGRPAAGMAAEGIVPTPGAPGSFFGTYSIDYVNPTVPAPLDHVEPSRVSPKHYMLGDGTLASADEIERIYAEQKRLIEGGDAIEPASRVRSVGRMNDGTIPKADNLAKDERELDATCHPFGGWEHDPGFPKYSERAQRYEEQTTHARGLDYVVRMPDGRVVKFEGCAVWDPRRQLLEAKGRGREGVLDFLSRRGGRPKMLEKDAEQARRQIDVAQGRRLDWHAAERGYRDALKRTLYDKHVPQPPTFSLYHTPAKP